MLSANETVNETGGKRDGKFRPGNRGGGGKGLMQARAREDEAAAVAEADAIARDLGRTPTALERVLINEIAALSVKARRLRSQGRPSDDVVRLLSRMCSQLGLNRAAPRARPQSELAALLKGGPGA
jgi:hypothetical protein